MTEDQLLQREIAIDSHMEEVKVKEITRSIFDFIKFQIESGERKPIRIPKWGVFQCKPPRVKALKERGLL